MLLELYLKYASGVDLLSLDLIFIFIGVICSFVIGVIGFIIARFILYKICSRDMVEVSFGISVLCVGACMTITLLNTPISDEIEDQLDKKPTVEKKVESYELVEWRKEANKCYSDTYIQDSYVQYVKYSDLGDRLESYEVSDVYINQGEGDTAVLNVYEPVYKDAQLRKVFSDYHRWDRRYQLVLPKECAA